MNRVVNSIPGINYEFNDPQLLREALTHKSVGPLNYERLEFLGDSILGLVVSTRLFERHPEASEGDLSRMRARLVRGKTLAGIAQQLNLGKQVSLGQGEMKSGGFRRLSILADALEALLGAIYLDSDFETCGTVIRQLIDPLIDELPAAESLKDPKTRLQEWLQARARPLPIYDLVLEEGADHAKLFHVICRLEDGDTVERASGNSRRSAEQAAATKMLEMLTTTEK